MKNALLVALNTLKLTFRKKSNIIIFIVVPIITVLVSIGIYSNAGNSPVNIGIVNNDTGKLSKDFIASLEKNEKFKISSLTESEVKDKVSSKKVDCALVIPKNFEESIYDKTLNNIDIISIKGEDATAWIQSYTNLYIRNLLDLSRASNGSRDAFNKLYQSFQTEGIKINEVKLADQAESKLVTQQSFGFLIMFILMGAASISTLMLKEKRDRTYFRICSSPVSVKSYILGNIIANIVMIFIQIVVVITVMTKVLKIKTYVPDLQLFALLMCFGLVAIGLGVMISSLANSSAQAGNLTTLIATPTCMLGGCFWSITLMPKAIQKISNFMPQKWVIDAMVKLQNGSSFSQITLHFLILFGFGAAFFFIAAYNLKHKDSVKNFV